ncbi:DUF4244 domain-containing protein [Kitasatospora sp. NPDC058965]|uniref:DUF4244 domain-containing protein n=1 Tax=Kitasatospora sp. NPDC058965 TaxID=3346682 RepID=UPI0036C05406
MKHPAMKHPTMKRSAMKHCSTDLAPIISFAPFPAHNRHARGPGSAPAGESATATQAGAARVPRPRGAEDGLGPVACVLGGPQPPPPGARHRRRRALWRGLTRLCGWPGRRFAGAGDAGMSTAEYAIGTVAACGFAALLYKVITGGSVTGALTDLLDRALHAV